SGCGPWTSCRSPRMLGDGWLGIRDVDAHGLGSALLDEGDELGKLCGRQLRAAPDRGALGLSHHIDRFPAEKLAQEVLVEMFRLVAGLASQGVVADTPEVRVLIVAAPLDVLLDF